ncbi:MAG: hypothetical protein LQ344_005820 [Seirophora lacunosa]|nr:MAG: hypothetical protein LQ344_005820 [Seirophora lacunosa]
MYFLKQLSIVVALGFALVDARAINLNGKNEITARDVTAARNGPRALGNPIGEKLAGRGLAKREDVDQDEEATRAQAKRCADALNNLRRKLRRRAARKAKRAGDDEEDGHSMLGADSYTVNMDEHLFTSEQTAHDKGWELYGTYGLNSCSGVLIVGDNGYSIAHISPIEETEDGSPDPASAQAFRNNVASMVEKDFNDNKENFGNAVMYALTPNGDKGEAAELEASAKRLGMLISKNTYDVVDEEAFNDDYFEKERGTMYLNRSDASNKKIKVNGDDPAAPQRPA